MTTDTALGVTKRCVEDGFVLALQDTKEQEKDWGDQAKAVGAMEWVNYPELNFGRGESVSSLTLSLTGSNTEREMRERIC